jgi:hypothetical protein
VPVTAGVEFVGRLEDAEQGFLAPSCSHQAGMPWILDPLLRQHLNYDYRRLHNAKSVHTFIHIYVRPLVVKTAAVQQDPAPE